MRRFGDFLLGLGLIVGIGSVIGYELDIIPTLPPELLKLVIYKLAFIGGLGLLIAGAVIRRLSSNSSQVIPRAASAPADTIDSPALAAAEERAPGIPARDDAALERVRREP